MTVEDHGDAAQEVAADGRDLDAAFVTQDEAGLDEALQPLEFVAEVFLRVDEEAVADGLEFELALAHEFHDDGPLQGVVATQLDAAGGGQPAGLDGLAPGLEFAVVLRVAGADGADGRDAQADEVVTGHGGVAHEVAAQGAALQGDGQVVVGQGEVVHADVAVTGLVELLDGQLHHGHAHGLVGQILAVDEALGLEALRQMGVAIDGHAAGAQGGDAVQGMSQRLQCLLGQAVDEVDVDGLEVERAGVFHQADKHLFRLDAVDGNLDLGIKILYAQADAVEPHAPDVGEPGVVHRAGVDLDGAFGLGLQADLGVERVQQFSQLFVAEEGGGATAQVKLRDPDIPMQVRRIKADFLFQGLQIGHGSGMVSGTDAVARAIMADGLAEGDVDVDGDGLPRLAQGAVVQPPSLFLGVEGLGEMIRRGVGGVPGPRLVENANQFECRHAVHTKSMNERDLVVLILVNGHL